MLTTYEADQLADEAWTRREFMEKFQRRNSRGNLSVRDHNRILTVFRKRFGSFGWSILHDGKLRYSPKVYPTESAALDSLYQEAYR